MILVINNHTVTLKDLKKVLKKLGATFIIRDQKSSLSGLEKKHIKGIILSGGGPNLDKKINVKQIRADLMSLAENKVPILGICEGHQIIGAEFGGAVKTLKSYLINKKEKIKILKRSKIFKGLPKEIYAFEYHGRYVSQIPKEFDLAAESKEIKNEAFFHKTRPIFSVQFHPERSGEHGEKIINNFLTICK